MVDGGEHVSATLKREFGEEALNSLEDEQKDETKKLIEDFFKAGTKENTLLNFEMSTR